LTDNGNHILDCLTGPIDNPSDLDRAIRALPGVVGTGFFLGMAERVLEGDDSFRLVAEYVRGSA
jgi:ribose 5-phosphate isomerase A